MLPKKSKDLYPILAERLGIDKDMVEDIVEDCFCKLRKSMEDVENIRFNFRSFKFAVTKSGIRKFKRRIDLTKKGTMTYMSTHSLKKDEEKLMRMEILHQRDVKHKEENKIKKLNWHKENEDPYGVYRKKLEEDNRRSQELPEEKPTCGNSGKKTLDIL